jgi:hypothetical protein
MKKNLNILSLNLLIFVFGFFLAEGNLFSQTIFIGPDNGDWETVSNWSTGLPAIGNDATIPGGKIACINGSITINYGVQSFGSVINKGNTTLTTSFISGGSLENQGTLNLTSSCQLTSSGGCTNSGTINNSGNINSNSILTNTATGTINNSSVFQQNAACTNSGNIINLSGTFSCPGAFVNNKTIDNRSGATWKVDFGGSLQNNSSSNIINAGTFQNLGSITNVSSILNTGNFTNNGVYTCSGTFENENTSRFESTGTMNINGTFTNKLGATLITSFRLIIFTGGTLSNAGAITNNDQIDVRAGGTYLQNGTATILSNFGSSILNAGTFNVLSGTTITSNGEIRNAANLILQGTIDASAGSKVINTGTLTNNGLLKSINSISNEGIWINIGTLENNSGSIFNNTASFTNRGRFINNFEVYNKPTGTFNNNGFFSNTVRSFNEGTFNNNSYFINTADVFNRAGATLTNTEIFDLAEGALNNEGTLNNQKTFLISKCGMLNNVNTLSNSGLIENRGVVLQKGTITGTPILNASGFVKTTPGSNVPGLCRTSIRLGISQADGLAKLYAPQAINNGFGLDSCQALQYFADGVNRAAYPCTMAGQTKVIPVRILLRNGDSLTCSTTIEVFDGVEPLFDQAPRDITLYSTQDSTVYSWPAFTATDNCSTNNQVVITSNINSGSRFPIGTTQVVVTARDQFNNASDLFFKVTVVKVFNPGSCPAVDATAPVFSNCPGNISVNSNSGLAVVNWSEPSVTDQCFPIQVTSNFASGRRFETGTTEVVYSARDLSGNTSTCKFNVTVVGPVNSCDNDQVRPTIFNCPANRSLITNTNINGAVGIWTPPTGSDNCSGAIFTSNFEPGSIFPVGATNVLYTARDGAGNTATCAFVINVGVASLCPGDITPPSLNCPSDINISTNGTSAIATWGVPVATDACSPVTLNGSATPGDRFSWGTTNVTYSASDGVGNRRTCTFKVNVINACIADTTRPVISGCPGNQTILSSNGSNAAATWTVPTATDNCATVSLVSNFQPGALFGIGTTRVSYGATDVNGNANTCNFNITVNISNVAACAGNIVENASFENDFAGFRNSGGVATITNDASSGAKAARICESGQMLISQNYPIIGGTYTLTTRGKIVGSTTGAFVGIDFYDATGALISASRREVNVNSTSYTTFTITGTAPSNARNIVVFARKAGTSACLLVDDFCLTNPCTSDVTPPVFAGCPSNQTLNLTGTANQAVANWTAPTVSDNCSTPSVVNNFSSGQSFPVGVTTVTYTATDARNNRATCSFTITVVNPCATDATAPVFTRCPGSIAANSTNGLCVPVNFLIPIATDNCGTPSVTGTAPTDFCFPIGATTVTYTAVDARNNQATCRFTVTVTGPNTGGPCNYTRGAVTQEIWTNVSGTSISDLTGLSTFPNTPNVKRDLSELKLTYDYGENYGDRTQAIIYPPVTGQYTFWIYGDDQTELFLSSDDNPVNKQKIASVNSWTSQLEITKETNQKSSIISLEANKPYYVEVLHKEGGGGDGWGVLWQLPSTSNIGNLTKNGDFTNGNVDFTSSALLTTTGQGCGPGYYAIANTKGPFSWATLVNNSGNVMMVDNAGDLAPNKSIWKQTVNVVANSSYTFSFKASSIYNLNPARLFLKVNNTNVGSVTTLPTATGTWITVSGTWNSGTSTSAVLEIVNQNGDCNGNDFAIDDITFTGAIPGISGTSSPVVIGGNNIAKYAPCVPVNPCATDATAPVFTRCPGSIAANSTNGLCVPVNFLIPIATDNCGTPSVTGTAPTDFCFPIGATTVTYTAVDARNNQATCRFTVTITGPNTGGPCNYTRGAVTQEIWTNVGGTSISDLTGLSTFPNTPNIRRDITQLRLPFDYGDNYGDRTQAIIYPPTTGAYTFWVYGDDQTDLFLSTDDKPANEQRIASVNTWTSDLEITKEANQKSATINLQANKPYYLKVLHKEGGGGDGWGVLWQLPSTTNNGNLTKNGDFTNGNVDFTSSALLTTTGQGCGPGYYAIANTKGPFSWATLVNNSGNVMMVDNAGDLAPNKSIWKQTVNVVANSSYTFSFKASSIYNLNPARLFLKVNNTNVGSVTTLPTATGTWITVSGTWNSGTSTSAVLEIVNQNGDCNGNDFAIDDITFTGAIPGTSSSSTPVIIGGNNIAKYVPCVTVDPCVANPSVGGTISPATQSITTAANGIVPIRQTLAGNVGTILRWEWQAPNSTTWNDWGGAGSNLATSTCCYNEVGTWRIRAIIKNGNCAEVPSAVSTIVVTQAPTGPCTIAGGLLHERWLNAFSWNYPVAVPTTAPTATLTPTPSGFIMPAFPAQDHIISRARGWIRVGQTGTYVFNITGDDYTELYLSTNATSSGLSRIAGFAGWTNATEYTKFPGQTSASITLQANTLYYVELRHNNGVGGNRYQVQWKTPTNSNWTIIPSDCLLRPCTANQNTNTMRVVKGPETQETLALSSEILLFPNPANQLVNIDFGGNAGKPISVTLINVLGNIIKTENFEEAPTGAHSWDISELPSGTYYFRVQSPNNVVQVKSLQVIK